jgi:hypothetical protein
MTLSTKALEEFIPLCPGKFDREEILKYSVGYMNRNGFT